MKKTLVAGWMIVAALALTACDESGPPSFSADQQARIEEAADNFMLANNIPAVILGVWEAGKSPLVLAKGKADLASGRPVDAADHFRIASITKTFTATVMLQLIEEKPIGFKTTIEKYFPDVTNADQITIQQVLAMTAGIYDFVNSDGFTGPYYNDMTKVWTKEEILALVNGQPADFAPGTSCKYSNTNYYLLGILIEELTGNKPEDEIKTRILAPLGLTDTSFPTDTHLPEPYCHGYNNIATKGVGTLDDVSIQSPSAPWTSGGMVSNINDLRTWVEALYHGTLLSPDTQAERLDWQELEGTGGKIKYGLGVINLNGLIGHNGEIEGYNTDMYYLPSKNAAIVCMTNNASAQYGHTLKLTKQVIEILYPGAVSW